MTDFKTKLATAFATGAVLLNALAPAAFAQTSLTITGNGSDSNSDINVSFNNDVNVDQNNDADINNDINIEQETGENDANDNTGGDVNVTTGNTTANVDVLNVANKNQASVEQCCLNNVDVNISGNGTNSDNNVDLNLDNDVDIDQDNDADIDNDVNVEQETGENDANDNTGGDVAVLTGDTNATVEVDNLVNFNGADIEGCGCLTDLLAKIAGNGTYSDNEINFDADSDLDVDQDNDANLDNDVNVEQETGENDVKDNTGDPDGDPSVETGNTDVNVSASNKANVNTFGDLGDWWEDVDFDFDFDFDLSGLLSLLLGGGLS